MNRRPQRRFPIALLASALLASALGACAPGPGPVRDAEHSTVPPASATRPLPGPDAAPTGDGRFATLDPGRSRIRVLAFRGGPLARLGHNHVARVGDLRGRAWLPAKGFEGARLEVEFRLEALVLDEAQERQSLGPAFSSNLEEDDIARTRAHLLGPEYLDAARDPVVELRLRELVGEGSALAGRVEVKMHGQTRSQWIAIRETCLPRLLCAEGSFVVDQAEFGIAPFTVLGGMLRVQSPLVIEFFVTE